MQEAVGGVTEDEFVYMWTSRLAQFNLCVCVCVCVQKGTLWGWQSTCDGTK